MNKSQCKSFNYVKETGLCSILNKTISDSGVPIVKSDRFAYFERTVSELSPISISTNIFKQVSGIVLKNAEEMIY